MLILGNEDISSGVINENGATGVFEGLAFSSSLSGESTTDRRSVVIDGNDFSSFEASATDGVDVFGDLSGSCRTRSALAKSGT